MLKPVKIPNHLEEFKKDFAGKKVLLMGLGLLGRGVGDAKFLAEIGAKVRVTDLKTALELKPSLQKLNGLPIKYALGKHLKKDFQNCDVVVRGAGVKKDSPFLKIAQKNGAQVVMDESLFARYAPVKIIGVTGSRGKTTTATMIYKLIKVAIPRCLDHSTSEVVISRHLGKKQVFLTGNILGKATLPLLAKVNQGDIIVMELSSWQLQGFLKEKKSPHIAVITSVFPDHLNYYDSMKTYLDDKKIIFQYQTKKDFLIANKDQAEVRQLVKSNKKSKLIWFSQKNWPKNWPLLIPGTHNRSNAAAALATARLLQIPDDISKKILTNFLGIDFRLEKITSIKNVDFINDSSSTTPASLEAGLKTFAGKKIVLIAGGTDKNLPLEKIARTIVNKVEALALLPGTGTEKLKKILSRHKFAKIIGEDRDLFKIVKIAFLAAKPDGLVLFSPGFTSFELFKNEYDRGKKFNRQVAKLTAWINK